MDTIIEYKNKLREIANLAFRSGVDIIGVKNMQSLIEDPNNLELKESFFIACHDGFKNAQKIIVQEVSKYQAEIRSLEVELMHARKIKDRFRTLETNKLINDIKHRLHSISHIADGIAWQLFGGQIHVARRFYIHDKGIKFLDSSNIKSSILAANLINNDPLSFALICDLTNYIQIGDLIIKDKNGNVGIMELKEGKVNDRLMEILKTEVESDDENILSSLGEKSLKQMSRMLRQVSRSNKLISVINDDEGVDPYSGENIKLHTPQVNTEQYFVEFTNLFNELEQKEYAYTVIDSCLHIGMYRDKGLSLTGVTKHIFEQTNASYIVFDFLSIIKNISEPIFAKPFPSDFIIDVMIGVVKITIGLDLDELIGVFNKHGLNARWMNRKETSHHLKTHLKSGSFIHKNRGITFENKKGTSMVMGGGIISKIIYDNIKPSNIALTIYNVMEV